jgi:hypothetical protein
MYRGTLNSILKKQNIKVLNFLQKQMYSTSRSLLNLSSKNFSERFEKMGSSRGGDRGAQGGGPRVK